MICLRAPSLAFQQTHGGRRLWPAGVDRETLNPYYERAERMLNVEQIPVEPDVLGRVHHFARCRPDQIVRQGLYGDLFVNLIDLLGQVNSVFLL